MCLIRSVEPQTYAVELCNLQNAPSYLKLVILSSYCICSASICCSLCALLLVILKFPTGVIKVLSHL